MKYIITILLLVISNVFMTFAWYGHLKIKQIPWFKEPKLIYIILISWIIALFEYIFQVPANRIGFKGNGGPFELVQLKVIQEVITLLIFILFSIVIFKTNVLKTNYIIAFIFLILAVYFVFKK